MKEVIVLHLCVISGDYKCQHVP